MTPETHAPHLFILCGPPGGGKTTLVKMIKEAKLPVRQIPRITTRDPRKEENDGPKRSLEYEFLCPEAFAGRVRRGDTINVMEWNGKLYATELTELFRLATSEKFALLLEDMPTAIHLKRMLGAKATVILLFVEDKDELRKWDFALVRRWDRDSLREWRRRIRFKYVEAKKNSSKKKPFKTWRKYLDEKVSRATPDLAFMAGKIEQGEDILVLANRKGQQKKMFADFKEIVQKHQEPKITPSRPNGQVFVVMPFASEFDDIYEAGIKPVVCESGFKCVRADELEHNKGVLEVVYEQIKSAHLVVADMTGRNPNVYYEVGYAHALGKDVVLLTKRAEELPVDLRGFNHIVYEGRITVLRKRLAQRLKVASNYRAGAT